MALNEVDRFLALQHADEGVGNTFLGRSLGLVVAIPRRHHNRAVVPHGEILGEAGLAVQVHISHRHAVGRGDIVVEHVAALAQRFLSIEHVERDVAVQPLQQFQRLGREAIDLVRGQVPGLVVALYKPVGERHDGDDHQRVDSEVCALHNLVPGASFRSFFFSHLILPS